MLKHVLFIGAILPFYLSAQSQMIVTDEQGSSVETELGYGYSVNKGSSLMRQVITLNDTLCPVQVVDITAETTYADRKYRFKSKGWVNPKKPISAYEIHIVLYNVFAEHIKTLSMQDVSDLSSPVSVDGESGWYADENDVSEYLISVAYVANVRTKDGQLWRYNYKAIEEELAKLNIAFSEENLPKKND